MGEETEPLYDDETLRLMSEAYEVADKELATDDKALKVTLAVAIIRAINEGERDAKRLAALALSSARGEPPGPPDDTPAPRANWVDLSGLLG